MKTKDIDLDVIRNIQEHYDYIYGINKVRLELIRNYRDILTRDTIARNNVLYNPHNSIYRNLIKVSSPTAKLFQRFGTDVCEVKTPEGKLYISAVQEQCCNGLFGYIIINVYKTKAYRNLCKAYNLTPSMSRPSTPTDNGQTELLFPCLVREKLRRITIISMKQVIKEIENYFYFYNYVRINERLGII